MASDAKACFSSKAEYRAVIVIWYLFLKGETGKELHSELADVYLSSAPPYAQVKFWVGEFRHVRTSSEDEARSGPLWLLPTKKCLIKFGIWYILKGKFRWKTIDIVIPENLE